MVENVKVNCQIPQEWKQKIEHLAAERKIEINQILSEAIGQYLGEDPHNADHRLQRLEMQVSILQKDSALLALTVNHLRQQLSAATSLIDRSAAPGNLSQKLQAEQPIDLEDEIEDEPDEILYEFLDPSERY